MGCREGIDPADFASGVLDPADEVSPPTSEVSILNTTATLDPDGTAWARFRVVVSNINFDDAITVRWDTADGSATGSGGNPHYDDKINQTLTIPAGEGEAEIEVQVFLGSPPFIGIKGFHVNLSVPSFATIADSQGTATIDYGALNDTDNPPSDPTLLPSYIGWTRADGVVYNQFASCGYKSACTAYAGAALMSALTRHWGVRRPARYDAKQLFLDAGGKVCGGADCNQASCNCTDCPPFSMTKVLKRLRDNGVNRIDNDASIVGGVNYGCKTRSPDSILQKLTSYSELGGSGVAVSTIIKRIKRAIHENGAVYMASIFYSNWNQCRAQDNYILRPHGNETSPLAHAWVLTGWDNSKGDGGCFEIQSSHGCDWGNNGRGWIPYSYLRATWPGGSAVRYRYWEAQGIFY